MRTAMALASALALGCSLEPTELGPPTELWARTTPEGIELSWDRSPDDGGGHALVREYQALRARSERGPFVPFAYRRKDGRRPTLVDGSALPGADYWYVVWALPERERPTVTEPGGAPARSAVAGPARLRGNGTAPPVRPPTHLTATPPDNDNGEHLDLAWHASEDEVVEYRALRGRSPAGPFAPFSDNAFGADTGRATMSVVEIGADYHVLLFAVPALGEASAPAASGPARSRAALFHTGWTQLSLLVVAAAGLTGIFLVRARKHGERMFIRRIPGIDAIEEAIGRATEMGRPVLFVPGVEESMSMQTVASILALGHVAERVARMGSELRVPVNFPMTLPLAQEAVKQGYLKAGRPDAYRPNHVVWISSEQFAFTAGTNGIILRDKPATNIFLGRFYAESLILAETGFYNSAIQIAGTAEIPQLPFFVAACDYTLIGEELFAMSAYLSRQPALLGTLKAGDMVKLAAVAVLLIGAGLGLVGVLPGFVEFFKPVG